MRRQHIEAQERLPALFQHCRHFVRAGLAISRMHLNLPAHSQPFSEKTPGTGCTQSHFAGLTEGLLQASRNGVIVEETGQCRVGRQQCQAALHFLPVYRAIQHFRPAQPQEVLHFGIAVLQLRGDFGGSKGHTIAFVHRVVLPQEEKAVAVGIPAFQPVFVHKIGHQQIGAGQSQCQAQHGD